MLCLRLSPKTHPELIRLKHVWNDNLTEISKERHELNMFKLVKLTNNIHRCWKGKIFKYCQYLANKHKPTAQEIWEGMWKPNWSAVKHFHWNLFLIYTKSPALCIDGGLYCDICAITIHWHHNILCIVHIQLGAYSYWLIWKSKCKFLETAKNLHALETPWSS